MGAAGFLPLPTSSDEAGFGLEPERAASSWDEAGFEITPTPMTIVDYETEFGIMDDPAAIPQTEDTVSVAPISGFLNVAFSNTTEFDALANPNVQAFLAMIRAMEARCLGIDPYQVIVGCGSFSDFSDHPHVAVYTRYGWSDAAGAYQFMGGTYVPSLKRNLRANTWDWVKGKLKLPDFSPQSQDKGAIYLLKYRGALPYVIRGDFQTAVMKAGQEWASFKGAGYGQSEWSLDRMRTAYINAGGTVLTA